MEASHLLSCILFVPALPTSWLFLVCLLDHLQSCLFLVWVAHMISCGGLAYMIKQQTDDKGGKRGCQKSGEQVVSGFQKFLNHHPLDN